MAKQPQTVTVQFNLDHSGEKNREDLIKNIREFIENQEYLSTTLKSETKHYMVNAQRLSFVVDSIKYERCVR